MADVKTNPRRKMEEDIYLINKVKESRDTDSVTELINRHSGIYIEMVNKYLPDSMEGINKRDVLEDKDFCIYDAAIKFDKTKNAKFSTYVGNLARWRCLNIFNRNVKFPQCSVSQIFDERVSCNPELTNIEEKEDMERIFLAVDSIPDKRVKQIFKMRYREGQKLTPWKKIAKKPKTHRQRSFFLFYTCILYIQ